MALREEMLCIAVCKFTDLDKHNKYQASRHLSMRGRNESESKGVTS